MTQGFSPRSAADLAAWAREREALAPLLAEPLEDALRQLSLLPEEVRLVVHVAGVNDLATLGATLAAPSFRAFVGAMPLAHASRFLKEWHRALVGWLDEEGRRRKLSARGVALEARPARVVFGVPAALAQLEQRLLDKRADLAAGIEARPRNAYRPEPMRVELQPARLVYAEHAATSFFGTRSRVVLNVEHEEIGVRCDCGRVPCAHAIAALDEAAAFLREPSVQRDALAAVMAVPPWQRFLASLDKGLADTVHPTDASKRLVWRVTPLGAGVEVEPFVQKRLKGGGFSQGQRVRPAEIVARARAFSDPRDQRAARVLSGYERGAWETTSARALDALVGHPHVLLENAPVKVVRRPLRVSVERDERGRVALALAIGSTKLDAAALARHVAPDEPVAGLDEERGEIVVAVPDARAATLVAALAKHPARFPPEAHDALLQTLASIQESVALDVPDELRGEVVAGDARPIVRLLPEDSGQVEVRIVVRPVEGGPTLAPGEGADLVFATVDDRRVTARRDRAAEIAAATEIASGLPPSEDGSPWTFVADEVAALDLLAKLRDAGEMAIVEWAEPTKRLALSVATAKELRVRVTDKRDWFGVDGEVQVDGATVPLADILAAVRQGKRYVRVGPGRFAAIEADLRRRVERASDVLFEGKRGVELSLAGAALVEDLVEDRSALEAAARFRDLLAKLSRAQAYEPALPEGLTAGLRHYQVDGFTWLMRLASWGSGGVLADDMGLGKTVQALAFLLARAGDGPALVITPTSVVQTWIDEAARFTPSLRVKPYRGAGRAAALEAVGAGEVLVTSYAVVLRDAGLLAEKRFSTLVLDEAHAVKNGASQTARGVLGLDAGVTVALTGTPVENHLGDLWSLMRYVTPGLLGSWEHFRDRFATAIEKHKDPKRRAALARVLRPFLLRRTKAEVAPELPPRTEIVRFVQPSAAERALYATARAAALEAIATRAEGDARFAVLAAITRLRRLACHPRLFDGDSVVPSSKLAAILEIVEELRQEGHRALVFSQFTSHLALVREVLDRRGVRYDYLDGSTPAEERAARVASFQRGGADLFLVSLKAGGSGLNLTAADYVIHLDPWWNPAAEDQATDRAHRIGQARAVTVIRLVSRGTIEEAVLALHGEKRALAASILDEGARPAGLSTEDLASLIKAGIDDAAIDEEPEGAEAAKPGDEDVTKPSGRRKTKGGAR